MAKFLLLCWINWYFLHVHFEVQLIVEIFPFFIKGKMPFAIVEFCFSSIYARIKRMLFAESRLLIYLLFVMLFTFTMSYCFEYTNKCIIYTYIYIYNIYIWVIYCRKHNLAKVSSKFPNIWCLYAGARGTFFFSGIKSFSSISGGNKS